MRGREPRLIKDCIIKYVQQNDGSECIHQVHVHDAIFQQQQRTQLVEH